MSLGLTTALLTSGSLGDDYGRRRVFVLGAVVLAAASVLGSFSPTPLVFVVGRLLQGVGAAALIACSLALVSHVVPLGPARATASGVWGAGLASGIGLGPLLAVYLPWRVAYAVIAAAALAVAAAALKVGVESRASQTKALDLPGIVLLASGLALVCAGLTESRGGVGLISVGPLLLGVVALALFVLVEHRSAAPMMPLPLFRSPALAAATLGALGAGLGIISVVSYFSTLAQRGLGFSAVAAAWTIFVWPALSVTTSLLTRHLSERVSGAARLVGGLVVVTAGMALLLHLSGATSSVRLVLAFVVTGIGTGVVNATLGREAVASVPPDLAGVGSGINNTSRYLGAAIGVTLVAVLTSSTGSESSEQLLANWDHALLAAMTLSLVALLCVGWFERQRRVL
ncbi:MAG: MFS transporter [Actinomycetota bacterium]|nr:MFS transporter [Actinomycetota bacterium]